MLYDRYQQKILKVVKVLGGIRRYRVLILSVLCAILALTAGFLATKGIVYNEDAYAAEIVYGDELACPAKALFSKTHNEYSVDGKTWSEDFPARTGEYYVRAVAKGSFGTLRHGEPQKITILPRPVEIFVASDSLLYGDLPAVTGGLRYGDRAICSGFSYEDITSPSTAVTPHAEEIVIYSTAGEDVTDCYAVTVKAREITFNRRPITLTVQEARMEYNGTPLTSDVYEVSAGTLAPWDDLKVTLDKSQLEIGSTRNDPTLKILTNEGQDVTGHYAIALQVGNLTVSKRLLVIYTESDSFVYDGTAHSRDDYRFDELKSENEMTLLAGHRIVYTSVPTLTNVGTVINQPKVDVVNEAGESVLAYYAVRFFEESKITVTPRPITVVTGSGHWTYDGEAHENNVPLVSGEYGVVEGQTAILTENTKVTNYTAGVENKGVVKIFAGTVDVTANYQISSPEESPWGTLVIDRRVIEVTSGTNLTFVYNGMAQQFTQHTITQGELVEGQELELSFTASLTDVGECDNTFEVVRVTNAERTANYTDNYQIAETHFGRIGVTKRPLTLRAMGATKVYDGTALSLAEFEIVAGSLAPNQHYAVENPVSILFAGSVANDNKALIYADGESENPKNDNYEITYEAPLQLKITKREICVDVLDATRVYNGKMLLPTYQIVGGLAKGDEAEVTLSSGILNVESVAADVLRVDILRDGESVKDANYTVTTAGGTLTVTPRPITLTAGSRTRVYDATVLAYSVYTYSPAAENSGLAEGQRFLSVQVIGSIVNKGSVSNEIGEVVIVDAGGTPVTFNYTIERVKGTLTVTPRSITVIAEDADKVYDGIALIHSGYTYSEAGEETGLCAGHRFGSVAVLGSIIKFGQTDNVVGAVEILDGDNIPMTENYEITRVKGKLSITKRPITFLSGSGETVYNAEVFEHHTMEEWTPTGDGVGLVLGEGFTAEYTATPINVGTYKNTYTVSISSGNDNYAITYEYGTLTIKKRPITVTSATDNRVYDGTPFTNGNYTYTLSGKDEGLLPVHHFSAVPITGSITFVGEVPNALLAEDIRIASSNADVTDNYQISVVQGTLTVTPRSITVTATGDSKTYDGQPLYGQSYAIGGLGIAAGDSETVELLGERLFAGTATVTVGAVTVTRDGKDVTYCYTVTERIEGTLTVKKRPIIVTAGSDSKVYDGTPLTCPTWSIRDGEGIEEAARRENGLADGDVATVLTTGSILDAGTAKNQIASVVIANPAAENGDATDNYIITYEDGTLEIQKRKIVIVSQSKTAVYNGKHLYWPYYDIDLTSGGYPPLASEPLKLTFTEGPLDVTPEGTKENNTFTVEIVNGKMSNYDIVSVFGTLTVTPRPVTFVSEDASKVYDGKPFDSLVCRPLPPTGTDDGLVEGETFTATFTEKSVAVGTYRNTFKVEIKSGTRVTTANYIITTEFGTLEITKRPIRITADSGEKLYDGLIFELHAGTPEIYDGMSALQTGLVEGNYLQKVVCLPSSSAAVGVYDNVIDAVLIVDGAGDDVTDNYEIAREKGMLEIKKRPITVEAGSIYEEFDEGMVLEAPLLIKEPNADLDALNEIANGRFTWEVLRVEGSIDAIGTVASHIPEGGFVIYLDGVDVTENFDITYLDGELTLAFGLLKIRVYTLTAVYDGLPHGYPAAFWRLENAAQLRDGHYVVADLSGVELVNAGTLEFTDLLEALMAAGKIKVYEGVKDDGISDRDVTDEYTIRLVGKPLTVKKRVLTITAGSAERVFDGEEHTCSLYTLTGSLAAGDYIEFISFKGSQTAVGSCANEIDVVVIRNAAGEDVTENYSLQKKAGVITVLPADN